MSLILTKAKSEQLYRLLVSLHELGMEYPQVLIHLASLLEPQVAEDALIPLLRKMFEEAPTLLEHNPLLAQKIISEGSQEPLSFRTLLDFYDLQQLLHQMSYLQVLHLSNNLLPPGPLNLQLEFLQKAQEPFQVWSNETLKHRHITLAETPLHMERQQLLQLEPQIPWEVLHFLIEILKLPIEDLEPFQNWFSKLPRKQLTLLIQLLHLEPSALIEIKRRLDAAIPAKQDAAVPAPPVADQMDTDHSQWAVQPTPSGITSAPTVSTFSSSPGNFQLKIVRQAPSRTVYQRILKPFPSIMLLGGTTGDSAANNLFVEATLIRGDSEAELPLCIEGNRIVRISNGVFATFKKLKILSTSQQQGTLFRLKFSLKRYTGNVFETLWASIISNPIEVFSHTLYLTEKNEAPPPTVYEVLPPYGGPGTRVVILGSNFVNSPTLKVRLGVLDLQCTFHEQGTLICNLPSDLNSMISNSITNDSISDRYSIPIRVSNDGINFCETKVFFTIYKT